MLACDPPMPGLPCAGPPGSRVTGNGLGCEGSLRMKHFSRLALAVLTATTLLIGPVGPADAHVRTAKTSLSLKVNDKSVHRGDRVVFTAHLKSKWKKCYSQRHVSLYRFGTKVAQQGTNRHGIAKFRFKAKHTAKWYVRFKGRHWGKHPHDHKCKPSQSRTIKVTVKK